MTQGSGPASVLLYATPKDQTRAVRFRLWPRASDSQLDPAVTWQTTAAGARVCIKRMSLPGEVHDFFLFPMYDYCSELRQVP